MIIIFQYFINILILKQSVIINKAFDYYHLCSQRIKNSIEKILSLKMNGSSLWLRCLVPYKCSSSKYQIVSNAKYW